MDKKCSAFIFWIVAISSFILSTIYFSLCLIKVNDASGVTCPYVGVLTFVLFVAFLCCLFWHCFTKTDCHRRYQCHQYRYMTSWDHSVISTDPALYPGSRGMVIKSQVVKPENFKMVPTEKVPVDFECSICNEDIGQDKRVSELTCGHLFHKDCILTWFTTSNEKTCPLCRTNHSTTEKLYVFTFIPAVNYHRSRDRGITTYL